MVQGRVCIQPFLVDLAGNTALDGCFLYQLKTLNSVSPAQQVEHFIHGLCKSRTNVYRTLSCAL